MKKFYWFVVFILVLNYTTISASPFPFDKVLINIQLFNKYESQVITSKQLDNLEKETNTPLKEIKILLYKAQLLKQSGDIAKGINLAKQALLRSELAGYNEWVSLCSIFLSSTFRQVSIETEAEFYLDKSKNYINQIASKEFKFQASFNTLLEESVQIFNKKDYDKALNKLEQAETLLLNNKNIAGSNYVICNKMLEQLKGTVYLEKADYNLSERYFRKCLQNISKDKYCLIPYGYNGLLGNFYQQSQTDSIVHYKNLIQTYLHAIDDYSFKIAYFKFASKFYQELDSTDLANKYLNRELFFIEKLWSRNHKVYNVILLDVKKEFQQTKKRYMITFWTLLILTPLVALFVIEKGKSKKVKETGNAKFKRFDEPNKFFVDNLTLEKHQILLPETDLNISSDTEHRLYKELIRLEEEQFYLDKTISLTKLANQLFTNSTYISYIVKKYRNQNFSDYIMNLRIQFLIQSLKDNEALADYKLSYLADFAGFLSHSKFTTSFKSIIGKTPSQYIDELRKR